jgi:hypothetical protein
MECGWKNAGFRGFFRYLPQVRKITGGFAIGLMMFWKERADDGS